MRSIAIDDFDLFAAEVDQMMKDAGIDENEPTGYAKANEMAVATHDTGVYVKNLNPDHVPPKLQGMLVDSVAGEDVKYESLESIEGRLTSDRPLTISFSSPSSVLLVGSTDLDPAVRVQAARLLGLLPVQVIVSMINRFRGSGFINHLLQDADPAVRLAAVQALSVHTPALKWWTAPTGQTSRATKLLLTELVNRYRMDSSTQVKQAVVVALCAMSVKQLSRAVPELGRLADEMRTAHAAGAHTANKPRTGTPGSAEARIRQLTFGPGDTVGLLTENFR